MTYRRTRIKEIILGTIAFAFAIFCIINLPPQTEPKLFTIGVSIIFVLMGCAFYFPDKFEWGMRLVCFVISAPTLVYIAYIFISGQYDFTKPIIGILIPLAIFIYSIFGVENPIVQKILKRK